MGRDRLDHGVGDKVESKSARSQRIELITNGERRRKRNMLNPSAPTLLHGRYTAMLRYRVQTTRYFPCGAPR